MQVEKLQKKEKLKNHNKDIFKMLSQYDFENELGIDYISDSGITIHDINDMISRLEVCGSSTIMSNVTEVNTDAEIKETSKVIESNCCHEYSICPICASAKRNEIVNHLKPYISIIKEIPDIYTYIATISIKGTNKPFQDYKKLRDSWTKFNKMGQRRANGRSYGEASKILGSLLSVEIVPEREDSNCFHVHGHALLVTTSPLEYVVYDQDKKKELSKEYGNSIPKDVLNTIVKKTISIPTIEDGELIEKDIAVSKISEQWYKSSGNISFWVKPVKDGYCQGKYRTIENQLYEIVKYSTKPWELDPKTLVELWGTLKGKRRITKAGMFTNSKKAQSEWRDILRDNNLLEKWDSIKPNDIKEDVEEDIIHKEYKYTRLTYNNKFEKFYEDRDYNDYTYKDTEEYKKYLSNKARILSDYRSEISSHINNLNIAKIFGSLDYESRIEWIQWKEKIKLIMRQRIHDESKDIKEFIKRYQEKILKDAPPPNQVQNAA